MSKINLTPNASGTGTLTVTSPNTNSDYTLTLPAVTGTFNTSGAVNEVPAGTASAPSIYFSGDTNTGIYSPGSDTIAFTEGGTEVMRIDSSGNVGIGVSGPSCRLDVQNATQKTAITGTGFGVLNLKSTTATGDYAALTFQSSAGVPGAVMAYQQTASGGQIAFGISNNYGSGITSEAMRIDSNGKLLVGTTTAASGGGVVQTLVGQGANDAGVQVTTGSSGGGGGLAMNSLAGGGAKFFSFTGNAGSESYTERMRIDSSGNLQFNSGYGSVATAYGCRAWVNFNGTGTVAIRASGNVTSITDNGTGDYTVNFTTAMPDANYCVSLSSSAESQAANNWNMAYATDFQSARSTSAISMRISKAQNTNPTDVQYVNLAVFR